jgi:hypothetical protein
VAQLGRNADGEVLVAGRVPDCYLGLRLDSDDTEATGVQVVAPPCVSTGRFPQPDGTVLYELVTGHPDRWSRGGSLWVELRLPWLSARYQCRQSDVAHGWHGRRSSTQSAPCNDVASLGAG